MSESEGPFYFRDRARSPAEAASFRPEGRDINIVKSAIQGYIMKWLLPGTFQNKLLIRHAPRLQQFTQDNREDQRTIHFDLSHSWSEIDEENTRKVQVARFVESLNRKFPAILLIDGGFQSRTAGLGDIQGGKVIEGIQFDYDLVTDLVVSLEIMIIAEDDATCNDLSSLVASTLGPPLRRFGGGNHIVSNDPENDWQITLPLGNSISALSRTPMGDDPQNQIWTASMSLEVQYDNTTNMRTGVPVRRGFDSLGSEGAGMIEYTIDNQPGNEPEFGGPNQIRVRNPTRFPVELPSTGTEIMVKPKWKLSVSDWRIATLDSHTMVLRPKRIGSITLRLFDENGDIIASKDVEIVP